MRLLSYAKVNLGLKILDTRADGFHNLDMITQSISLHDVIEISKIKYRDIIINCDKKICEHKLNLAYKAADLMFKMFGSKFGVKIDIKKNIPTGAGLGGGSSNAAAVIFAMIKMLHLSLSEKEIIDILLELGSDVPLCFFGGTLHCQGKGELLTRINHSCKFKILIKKHGKKIFTHEAYNRFDNLDLPKANSMRDINYLKQDIETGNVGKIDQDCFNDFELITDVDDGWHLTGSGSATFKILSNNSNFTAKSGYILCNCVNSGVKLVG